MTEVTDKLCSTAYNISFYQSLEIVIVIYQGQISLDNEISAIDAICQEYHRIQPLRILLDVTEAVLTLSIEEQIQIGTYLSGIQTFKQSRIAVFHSDGKNPHSLIDTIAFNQGITLAQFLSRNDAIDWLHEI